MSRLPLYLAGLCFTLAVSMSAAEPTIDVVLEQAAAAIVRGDDAGALERLAAASRMDAAPAGVFVALARLQVRRGDLRRAYDTVVEALARDPANAEALSLRGDMMRAAGRLDEAEADYTRALALDPADERARIGLARLHVADGDLEGARAASAPDDGSTLALRLALADAAAERGELEAAVAELDELLDQNPGWVEALIRRGDYQRRLENVAAAHDDFERALILDARSAEAHYRRGLLRRDLKDITRAFDDFNRAIDLEPRFVAAYVARGALYQDSGRQRQALRDFDIALELEPSDTDALTHKAASHCAAGAFDTCLQVADAALATDEGDWRAHVARGHALLGSGAQEAAIDAYGDAIRHVPESEAQWLLARLQRHVKPRIEQRSGFSWQFLAARDVVQFEEMMAERDD